VVKRSKSDAYWRRTMGGLRVSRGRARALRAWARLSRSLGPFRRGWLPFRTSDRHAVTIEARGLGMRATTAAFAALWVLGLFGASARGTAVTERGVGVPRAFPEVLVAEDVTPLAAPVWCGPHIVVVSGGRTGLRWIDLSTRKTTVINRTGGEIACSPDGRWIVYVEPKSSRMVDIDPHSPRWDPAVGTMAVRDFWRYGLEDGRRERFAVAAGGGQWSPDGTRLLFYSVKPRTTVTNTLPLWSLVYSRQQWPPGAGFEAAWLEDSRHILILSGRQFYAESVDPGEPIRRLQATMAAGLGLRVDRLNRVYLLSGEQRPAGRRELLRCRIEDETIVCEPLVSRAGSIVAFDVTSDGDTIVFSERGSDCLSLWRRSTNDARCVVYGTEKSGFKISPDGSRLAFGRERRHERKVLEPGFASLAGRTDLFVIDVPRDSE